MRGEDNDVGTKIRSSGGEKLDEISFSTCSTIYSTSLPQINCKMSLPRYTSQALRQVVKGAAPNVSRQVARRSFSVLSRQVPQVAMRARLGVSCQAFFKSWSKES